MVIGNIKHVPLCPIKLQALKIFEKSKEFPFFIANIVNGAVPGLKQIKVLETW